MGAPKAQRAASRSHPFTRFQHADQMRAKSESGRISGIFKRAQDTLGMWYRDMRRSIVSVVFLFFSSLIISSAGGLLSEWSALDFGYLINSRYPLSHYISTVSLILSVFVLYGIDILAAILIFYFIGKIRMVSGTNSILSILSVFFGSALGLVIGTVLVLFVYKISFPMSSFLFLSITSPYFAVLLVSSYLGLALGLLKNQQVYGVNSRLKVQDSK